MKNQEEISNIIMESTLDCLMTLQLLQSLTSQDAQRTLLGLTEKRLKMLDRLSFLLLEDTMLEEDTAKLMALVKRFTNKYGPLRLSVRPSLLPRNPS